MSATGQHKLLSAEKYFSGRLTHAMKLRGMSGSELAGKIGVDRGYISLLKSGRRKNPSQEVVHGISVALRVCVDWLLTGEGEMDVPDEAEIEAHVAQTLSGGPQAAAAAMSDERLEEALAEWQAMLATAQPFMRSAILGNISLFAAELQRREQKK